MTIFYLFMTPLFTIYHKKRFRIGRNCSKLFLPLRRSPVTDREVEGTDVVATTLHALLELDAELQTKLDLAKLDHAKVAALMKLQVVVGFGVGA